jgi:hypothetical protein
VTAAESTTITRAAPARVTHADSVEEVAAGFVHETLEGAGQVIAAAREAAENRGRPPLTDRPASITQLPPGEIDFDLLGDSDYELTERYDPEGNLEESWLSCSVLRWRTDFVAPGTIRSPNKLLERVHDLARHAVAVGARRR